MQMVELGGTGMKVSRLSLGTMTFGNPAWKSWVLGADRALPVLNAALDAGINFFDMADWYSLGACEALVGPALLARVPRDQLVLATKVFYQMSDDPADAGLSRRHIMASIDRSLKRIGTDHVDLYVIHAFDPATPIEETMEALHDVVKAGKARAIGASTMYAWQFCKMNWTARLHGWTPFANMQLQLNLLYREEEREMIPYCRDEGIAVTAFSPLARGFLSGGDGTARTRHDPYRRLFGDAVDRAIAARVAALAQARGVTPAQIALAWVAGHPDAPVPIFAANTVGQLREMTAALDIVLAPEERLALEELYRPADMINDYAPPRRARAMEA
ncbi:MAG: aldo/keto reductase [Alphaproteobacteria bacterium]